MTDFNKLFETLYADAVIWKATRIWSSATNPDDLADAVDELGDFLMKIPNEAKRTAYTDELTRLLKIKNSLLRKKVKDLVKKAEIKREEAINRAKLERQFENAEAAGLPQGFKGNIYDALEYNIYEHEDIYYTRGMNGDYPISNFTMKILYHSDTGEDLAFRLVSIKNKYGFEKTINFNTDDFVSLGSFKKIIARHGNYVFKGKDSDLARLQELLQRSERGTKYVRPLGFQKTGKFWAWGNGITPMRSEDIQHFMPIDDYGIIEYHGKDYFIPAGSTLYADKENMYINEKRFIYTDPHENVGFKEWCELMSRSYLEKAVPSVLFYIAALFRDHVMKVIQRFPILDLFGPPQCGKGSLAQSLMSMFGERQDQIMLGGASTPVGFMRKAGQLSNGMVWLDEYKNSAPIKIIESIKNLYDGIGYERGKKTNDLETESTPVLSSFILSGQEMPTGEAALFTRILLVMFDDGKHRTEDQKDAFEELQGYENMGGFSYLTAEIVKFRTLVEQNFETTLKDLQRELSRRLAGKEIEDRFIVNISIILSFRKIFNGILDFSFTWEEALQYLIDNITKHQLLKAGNDDVSKFWQVVESLFVQDIIFENKDFMLEAGYLYIKIQQVHPLYQKEMIARRDMTHLPKSTLEHYLQLDRSVFVEKTKKQFPDGSYTHCYKMKYEKLGIDLIRVKSDGLTPDQVTAHLILKQREMAGEITPGGYEQLSKDGF